MRTTDSTTGALLGDRYFLTRPLGAGASATVYLAEDRSLRREVAVKVLRSELSSDAGFQRRFRAEAVAAAGLNHPHVLSVFDWGEATGEAWLVTEFLSGGSLRDLLDMRGRLSPEQVASIGAQAADGLAYAHSRGFVHRDVKPANLLFDDAGRVRIADFGVARALAEAAWTEPTGGLIGTVRYASPEQAQGLPVDGKADVYSLALVLYECLTGEVPFTSDSQVATLQARVGATLPAHPRLGPLAEVLRAAASPEPASRLDAAALLARLTQLTKSLPDPAPLRTPKVVATVGFHPPTPAELTGQHRVVAPLTPKLGAAPAAPAATAPATTAADASTPFATDLTEVAAAPEAPPNVVVPARAGDETVVGAAGAVDMTVVGTGIAADATVLGDMPGAARTAPGPSRSKRWWLVGLLVLLLVVGAVGGSLVALRRPASSTFRAPTIVGMQVTAAQAELAHHEVTIVVDRLATSKTRPLGTVIAQRPAPGQRLQDGATVHVIASAGPPPVAIPVVVGQPCASAISSLHVAGFTATCPASLAAYSQSVAVGDTIAVYAGNAPNPTTAPYGSALELQVSKGRPPVPIPTVVGLPGTQAVTTLQHAGFVPVVVHRFSHTVHAGNVITTAPGPRVPLTPGASVTVVVSEGVPVTVPRLGHMSFHQAELAILNAGLNVASEVGKRSAKYWTSDPPPGTVVGAGSAVVLIAG